MASFGSVRLEDGEYLVACPPHVMLRLKRVFERVSKGDMGVARLSDSIVNARELEWFLERFPMEMSENDRTYLAQRAAAHREKETEIGRMMAGGYVPRAFPLAIPPREYQRLAADLCLSRGSLLCADQLGLGKTAVGICVLAAHEARPALVVCPPHLQAHWVRQLAKFLPEVKAHVVKTTKVYDLSATEGRKRKRGAATQIPLPGMGTMPDVVILTYSKLSAWAETLADVVHTVVYDEVQELRHDDTHKHAAARHLRDHVAIRLGLSASPVYNYGSEIFAVLSVIDPAPLGTRTEFSREWCGGNIEMVQDPRALGQYLRQEGAMIRRTRDEVGRELPACTRVVQAVPSASKHVDDVKIRLKDLARTILADGVKGLERMQAASELDWRLREATGIDKAPFVADFVRALVESGEPVVLFGWHHAVYAIWKDMLVDLNPVFYTGQESPAQKEAARTAFLTGTTKLFIMSLRSGVGLDGLQEVCATNVFGELDWSPQVIDQCEGRTHRDGQTRSVFSYVLVSNEGSDPVIADVLDLKRAQSEPMIDPDRALFEPTREEVEDRMRALARSLLEQAKEEAAAEAA